MSTVTPIVRAICVCVVTVTLAACHSSIKPQQVSPNSDGNILSAAINSTQTGHVYGIYIYLPASYASSTRVFPVIYATDGDSAFPPEGRFGNFKRILQNRNIEAILIGIGGSRWRNEDYVLPGAKAYHEFITRELIPFVESHFRADPKRRILSGLSLGGSFVVTSLFLEANDTLFFSHYVSAEGTFSQSSFIAQERRFSSQIGEKKIPATLILARGYASSKIQQQNSTINGTKNIAAVSTLADRFSEATNSVAVDSLYRRMTKRNYLDLILIETSFPTDHGGTDIPSFDDAMARIFELK